MHNKQPNTITTHESGQPKLPAIMLPREKREVQIKRGDIEDILGSYKRANLQVYNEGLNFSFRSDDFSLQADIKWSAIKIIKELFR